MPDVFGPKKPLFGPYTYRAKQNSNGDTLIAVYHGSKRVAHIDAYWAYSMRAIEEHEAAEAQRASGSGGTRRRLVCATDLYVWKLLRLDLGRSPESTRATMLGLVHLILEAQ